MPLNRFISTSYQNSSREKLWHHNIFSVSFSSLLIFEVFSHTLDPVRKILMLNRFRCDKPRSSISLRFILSTPSSATSSTQHHLLNLASSPQFSITFLTQHYLLNSASHLRNVSQASLNPNHRCWHVSSPRSSPHTFHAATQNPHPRAFPLPPSRRPTNRHQSARPTDSAQTQPNGAHQGRLRRRDGSCDCGH